MLDKVTLVLQKTLRVLEASRRTWDAAFAKTRSHSRRPASLGAALMATEKFRLHMQGAWLRCVVASSCLPLSQLFRCRCGCDGA
jgi:hypothetical protein